MKTWRWLAAPLALATAAVSPRDAAAQWCSSPYFVEQTFTSGSHQTAWRICWATPATYGLAITSAHFRTGPGKPWVRVFWDARVAEIFVPYHSGSPRYYDLSGFSFSLTTLSSADCPAAQGGLLLGSPARVCRELRNRGLAWKSSSGGVYRGQDLVLWSAMPAGNYVYIFRWTFRDDGVVLGEVGATGANLPSSPTQGHMHNASWRLDIDLNGFWNDNVRRARHVESGLTATDPHDAIPTEQGSTWNDLQFTALHIYDSGTINAHRNTIGYMLVPMRTGTQRHNEAWTTRDFWVTQYPGVWRPAALPGYISSTRSVSNRDVVVWYTGAAHHLYRNEDGTSAGGWFTGTAQVMWAGFMLKPHHLFDSVPFFP